MNNCQKCNKTIPNGEIFASLDYNIETMKNDGSGISIEVISSETIQVMCKNCAINNDPKKTKTFLKNVISQNQNLN